MNSGSVSLGSLFGIRVNLHWSVVVIAVLVGTSLAHELGVPAAMLGAAGFLASILVHELSHALTARHYDVETESIQLWALGGIARLSDESPTARAEGWIAAAGPLASLGLGLGLTGLWWVGGGDGPYWGLLAWLGFINGLLAVFNLLPGAPLDGGRIVKAWRWGRHGNRYRATREAGRAGVVLAWAMMAGGLMLLVDGQSSLLLIITGMFILVNARVEMAASVVAERLDGVTVGDLTWYGVAQAGPDMDADSMLWQRTRLGAAGGVAVTNAAGELEGLVLEDQLWDVPADQRPWVMLTQLMVPVDRVTRARADEPLTAVLTRLDPRRPAITVWSGDRLIGMVPPSRLQERLDGVR